MSHSRRMSVLLLLSAAFAPCVHAKTVAEVASPSGTVRVELDVDDGHANYRVFRKGAPLVETSRLGFLLTDGSQRDRNMAFDSAGTPTVHDARYTLPWGERLALRDRHTELRATFRETIAPHRRYTVVVRAFDTGVALRYEFPHQPALREVRIADELTEFNLARSGTAWWIPAGEWNRYEYLYNETPLEQVAQAHTPITMQLDDGTHVAIHEAALVDYAAMWLRRVEGRRFRARLSPSPQGPAVTRTAPFATPWRVLMATDHARELPAASDMVLHLNAPNALGDVSWFKPSKYIGIWWSLHLETESWATGATHGATTANTRRYIDFAARHGFRGVLVEGWNPGWDGQWFANGLDFDFTRATDDFDIEALSAYGRAHGVHLIGHHETGCAVSHYERQLPAALDLYARLGVDAVKTGYVCDAGQIRRQDTADGPVLREWHDGQWMSRHHLRVVTEAAKRHIAINAHEPIKDTGLRRTYPNWISREGARGMEYQAWGQPQNPPRHEVDLVYTRLLAGPMDYTPGLVSLQGRHGPIPSTLARQLALMVVLYSPVQMAADLPEHYEARPDAFEFIKAVPADWRDTRVPAGEAGDFVVVARQPRDGQDWYLGAITDEQPRTVRVPLDFLDAKRRYRAHVYRDGDGAHYIDNRFAFARETREVTVRDTLELALAAGGGQAIRFEALR